MNFPSTEIISIPLLSLTTPRVRAACENYPLPEDDTLPTVFVVSYPKSGTTWMQWIVYSLITANNRSKSSLQSEEEFRHISDYTPFYEIEKTWDFSTSENGAIASRIASNHRKIGYHVFNTHLPYQWLPKDSQKIKYLYIMRSGKDAAVSFYYHLTNQANEDQYTGDFSSFLEDFLSGKIAYGKWIDHLYYWLTAFHEIETHRGSQSNPILLLQYESLVSNLKQEVERIISFLELSHITPKQLEEEILPTLSFQYMKTHLEKFSPVSVPWKEGYQFLRKGQIGDNLQLFSAVDHARYRESIASDLRRISKDVDKDSSSENKVELSMEYGTHWLREFRAVLDL